MIYYLPWKMKAIALVEDKRTKVNILFNGAAAKRNTIDYMFAYSLGLKTGKPNVTQYTNDTFDVQETVELTLDVPVTNIESRLITIEADLIKHSNSMKETIKLSREVIKKLIAYIDYSKDNYFDYETFT